MYENNQCDCGGWDDMGYSCSPLCSTRLQENNTGQNMYQQLQEMLNKDNAIVPTTKSEK